MDWQDAHISAGGQCALYLHKYQTSLQKKILALVYMLSVQKLFSFAYSDERASAVSLSGVQQVQITAVLNARAKKV